MNTLETIQKIIEEKPSREAAILLHAAMETTQTAVGSTDWLDAFKAALRSRGMADRILRAQMKERTDRGQLAQYGQLPGWSDYQTACDEVTRLETEYIETALPASNKKLRDR